jgi:hypothetical protein
LPNGRLVTAEWNEFGAHVFAGMEQWLEDIWVPAPIAPHLLATWTIEQLERDLTAVVTPVVEPLPHPDIPFVESLPDGRVLLSHAPGICPLDCIEPSVCAITEDTRWWEMRRTIERLVEHDEIAPPIDAVAMFFCKHHCDPGQNDVGGIAFRTIFEEAGRVFEVARRRSGRIAIATLSSCHGVVNVFDVEARDAQPADLDARRCPICGGDNRCDTGSGGCWCRSVRIDADVLDRVPEGQRGRVCICPKCAGRSAGLARG